MEQSRRRRSATEVHDSALLSLNIKTMLGVPIKLVNSSLGAESQEESLKSHLDIAMNQLPFRFIGEDYDKVFDTDYNATLCKGVFLNRSESVEAMILESTQDRSIVIVFRGTAQKVDLKHNIWFFKRRFCNEDRDIEVHTGDDPPPKIFFSFSSLLIKPTF